MTNKIYGKEYNCIIIDDLLCPTPNEIKIEEYYKKIISKRLTNNNISILSMKIDSRLITATSN